MPPTELEKLIEEQDTDKSDPPSDEEKAEAAKKAAEADAESGKKTDEELKREEHLANLNKAIGEATVHLRKIRRTATAEKGGMPPVDDPDEDTEEDDDDVPTIDKTDPSSRAWLREIEGKTSPIAKEMEKEKEEVRTFALQEFLRDKPALANNPAKIKELVEVYDQVHTASERTREGVLVDLNKAFAVVYHDQLIEAARNRRFDSAKAEELFAEPAVERGATRYQSPRDLPTETLSEEDKRILAKWGQTPEDYHALKKEQAAKQ